MLLRDEFRKYRSFKEAYIGWLMAFVLFVFITAISPADYGQWSVYQQNVIDITLCVGIVVIMGVSRLFSFERESKFDLILGASKHGYRDSFAGKVTLAVCICLAAVAVFGVLDLVCSVKLADPERLEILEKHYGSFHDKMTHFYFYSGELKEVMHPDGYTVSIQVGDVPQMTNAVYYVVQYVFMFLAYLYFAGFIMVLSALTKNTSVTVAVSGLLFAISMYYRLNCFIPDGRTGGDWLYRLSFGGFVFHDSFSWYTSHWSDVWKPIVFCLTAFAAHLILLWFIWKRRERV